MPAKRSIVGPEAAKRLADAVKYVEDRSAAEVVVAVEPVSGHYGGIDATVGAVLAWLVLLYTLFAPQVFDLLWIALYMPVAFGVGVFVSRLWPSLRRFIAGRHIPRMVQVAAHHKFMSLGVHATRQRSGILVYVSVLERRVAVVADIGVRAKVPAVAWEQIVTSIERVTPGGRFDAQDVDKLAAAIEAAAIPLQQHLPRSSDDIDELPNIAFPGGKTAW